MTAPKRIQRRRTKGWRMPEGAIYVGRPSLWGNPFQLGKTYMWMLRADLGYPIPTWREPGEYDFGLRVERLTSPVVAVEWYRGWLAEPFRNDPAFLVPLRGHDLACWCPLDQPCHADVLLELA